MVKRAFDIALALLGTPVAAPVIAVCALLVLSTSPGGAIFRQVRIGRYERPFICYKLRTMYVETGDAPSHETAASAVTPVGRVLRRLKLDELPQLLNIIRGEMSFVGPRPCLPSQTELIAARRARRLYDIRPGITGPAQVAGVDMSNPEFLADTDEKYLQNMSITNDLKLILYTVYGAGRGDRVSPRK